MKQILIFIFFISQWSVQAQMVGTPVMPYVLNDRIKASLSTNVNAYNAAASNTLVEITLAEYNSILVNVTGAAKKGYMGNMALSMGGFGILGGTNNISTGTVDALLTNSYIVAVAYQTYSPTSAHIQITASASASGATTCLTSTTSAIPWTAYVTKYFAVKKPTTNSGTKTYVGHIPNGTLYGTYAVASVGCSYNTSTCGGAASTSHPYAIGLQVIATTTQSW